MTKMTRAEGSILTAAEYLCQLRGLDPNGQIDPGIYNSDVAMRELTDLLKKLEALSKAHLLS